MIKIELRPLSSGPIVEGSGKNGEVLYLMGREGALRWAPRPDAAALSLAVVFFQDDDATLAPVHPMCHVSGDRLRQLSLGSEKYDVRVEGKRGLRYRRIVMVASLIFAALSAGWYLRGLVLPVSPASAATQEEMYMF